MCNNLILKYVEEDIVLSLNVRNLKVSSANEIWEPAFTELSLPELIMRKLLKITDMTICLDKRNASGKIDTYQEPLLYRCSLSVHAAWCYDSLHSKIPSVSRFEVKCPKLDFSLTDTQIPMFMRIVNLLLALYYGEVVQKSRRKIVDSAAADVEEGEGGFDDHGDGERDSWGGWAWNVGTSVGTALLPIYWEDEEGEGPNAPKVDVKRDKVVHFAAFIDSASLVFKLTEHQTVDKSMFGSMKLCFTPFARMDCNGIFSELIVKGIGLVNVAGGVSEIILAPTGHCLCGVSDTKSNGDPENPFVQCGQPGQKKYLKGSLFEKDFGSETGGPPKERQKSYKIDWESHMESVTEDNMLERSPAVAVDYMYVLDIPNDYSSEQLSEIGFDLEYSNLSERALCRFVFGPSRLNVCSGLIHRVQTLVHFGSMYDYPPYKITPLDVGERVNEAPSPEEVDRLQHETPLRVYQLTAINPTVYVYAADHPLNLPLKSLHMRPSYPIKALALEFLPGIIVKMECLDSQFSHPMYPYRIVSATAALKNPPANLMQKCHSQFTTKVMQVSAHIFNGDQSTTLIQPSNFQIGLKTLQLPEIWNNELLVKKDYHFDLTTFKVKLTRPQTLVLSHILQSQFQKNPVPLKISETSALEDALTKRMSSFVFQVSGVRLQLSLTDHIQTIQATVENVAVNMFVVSKDQSGHSSNILPILSRTSNTFGNSGLAKSPLKMSPGRAHTRNDDLFFSIHAQFPRKSDHQQVPSLLVGHISHIDVNLDPKIVEWYFYFPTPKTLASATPSKPIQREVSVVSSTAGEVTVASDNAIFKSSTLSDSKAARKSKSPSPFVGKETKSLNTGTSEKQTVIPMGRKKPSKTSAKPGPGTMISDWFPTLNSLLIQIKIDGHHIYLPQKSLVSIASKTVAETIQKSLSLSGQYPLIGISLPSITLENVAHKPVVQQFLSSFPISLPEGVWNIERDNLPWTLKLSDFSIFSHNESKLYMLDHVSTSCTLALKMSKTKSAPKTLPQNLSLTIHTDMSPIKFELSETQLQLLISLTEDAIGAMAKLNPSILVSNSSASSAEINVKSPMSSPEGSSTGISATRPIIDTMSDTPTSQYVGKSGESGETETGSTVSLWIQWTVPLISCALITKNGSEEIKIKMDMEDCQSSFDWTPIYFKMKSRVLAANIRCKVRKKEADWEDSANKGIVLSCSDDLSHEIHFVNAKNNNIEMLPHSRLLDSDTSVFNFTFTRAECSNVKRKWKDLIRKNTCQILEVESEERPRFLCEIDMKLAPFDVVISPPEIIPFVRMMSHVVAIKIPKALFASPPKSTKSEMIGLGLNNNTLPRVYLRAKTIRVFLLSSYVNEESHLALSPDFLLLQLDSCNITPQVENPLSRILIRPEIYHMATPMLSLPGAHIEDRQYMITFTGIGVFTGRWHDMLKKSEKPPKPLLKTMGENPALEWNTTKELTDQQLAMEVLLLPCLSKFDLAVTMAPAIVLMQHKNGASVQKLIAGHAIEINATQDIAFFLSLCQIKLISLLTKECIENIKYVYQKLKTGSKGVLDSGVDCDASSQSRVGHETSQIQKKTRFVPTEMLITGSKITCSLFKLSEEERGATRRDRNMWRKYRYKHRRKEIMEERGQVTEESDGAVSDSVHHEVDGGARREGHSKSREDFGYEASEEGSIEELHETIKIYPLMYLSIQQPHIFLSCAKANQKLDISFYDAGLNLSPPEYFITCGGKRLPEIMDYPTKWFQSRQGDVNPKSGIPPALFTATIANFITKPCSLSITLERPLKFEVGLDLISQLTSTIDLIKESSNVEDILALISSSNDECGPKYEIRSGSTLKEDQLTLLRRQFSSLASICFSTKQIVMHCPISSSANCIGAIDLLGGIMGLNINVKLQSKWKNGGAELDLIKTDVALDKLLIRLGIGGIVQNFIAPWSCTLVSSVYWLPQSPLPVVSLSISSGAVNIKCGPNHIIAIKSLLNQRDPAEDSKSEKIGKGQDQSPEEVCTDTEPSGGDTPTEQAYSDDLRAGAFQYITSGSSDDPKPYQVVFSSSPPSMTWKYPQPRTLTRVTVYPVPFMSASESGSCNSNENTEGVRKNLETPNYFRQMFLIILTKFSYEVLNVLRNR